MKTIIFLLTLILSTTSYSQNSGCLSDVELEPAQRERIINMMNTDFRTFQQNLSSRRAAPIVVPIQIHIIADSNGAGGVPYATVQGEIANFVNPRYAAIDVSFVECGPVNYVSSDTYYNISGKPEGQAMSVAYSNPDVLNIYFVNNPDGACGWARFTASLPEDYIVIANSCANNTSTLAHEIGHYFDLYHTHETAFGDELVDGTNCTVAGDLFCSTPADPRLSSIVDAACNYFGTATDANGDAYTPDTSQIMSYAPKTCRVNFTQEAYDKILFTIDNNRSYLNYNCGLATNDLCVDATPINYGSTTSGTTTGTTFDDVGFCGTSNTSPGVWYSFVGLDGITTLSTCNQATYDTKISVFSGDCNALNCVGGNDDTVGCAGFTTQLDVCTTAGVIYYVLVHGFGGAEGTFDLSLSNTPSIPVITCPANSIVECGLNTDPASTGNATAIDSCDPSPAISFSDSFAASCGNTGVITRTWTATNNYGNTANCIQLITIVDTTSPLIVCPANVTVESDLGLCTASGVDLGLPALSDACGTVSVVNNAPLTYGFGDTLVTWTATDQCGNSSQCIQTVTVDEINTITTVTVDPISQQYSDLVYFEATIQPGNCPGVGLAATKVSFYVRGQKVGTANLALVAGNLVGGLTASLLEIPSFPSNGHMAPGVALVTAEFEGVNPNYEVNDATTNLTITQEDAIIDYNGHTLQATPNSTSSIATVTLSANIQDITVSNPDPDAGDIRNALVKFINRDSNSDITGWIPVVDLVDISDNRTATVSFDWEINIGNLTSKSYTVGIVVSGYYFRDSSDDNTVVTVYKPVGDFITGGGYIIPDESFGVYASTDGLKTNFGYNVKYNKKGKKLKGHMNIIFRRLEGDGIHTYQIKGNAIQSLGVNIADPDAKFGEFITKANLKDITNPLDPINLGGNLRLKVEMTDRGEPGSDDSIGINLINSSNTLLYSSNWLGISTEEMMLSGGNLVVHSGFSLTRTFEVFEVNSWPNPSDTTFNLKLNSTNDEMVDIIVFDINNKVIRKDKFNPKDVYEFGAELQSGLYFVQISQGSNIEIMRLIKY